MERRSFIKSAAAVSLMPALPITNIFAAENNSPNKKSGVIKPKRLSKGNTIGLITPGSSITKKELSESIDNLEELGFKVSYTPNIFAKHGYLAGTDKQRADDVNNMFADSNIDGIVCARGGYGCDRILPMLDYNLIKHNPKVLVGYSDITSLICAIYAKTGLVSFHGPVGISTFNDFSINNFENVIVNPMQDFEMVSAEETVDKNGEYKKYTIRSGISEGKLYGGNLSILTSLVGSPYDADYTGKIIYIEEVGEEPYRIDRMLTQLLLAGKLQKAAGIALGIFKKCSPKSDEPSLSLSEVLYDRLFNLGIPVIYGLSFGHIENKFTIPTGIKAKLDVTNQTLTLLESAVV